jgi:CAAX prenyl protease-like protein
MELSHNAKRALWAHVLPFMAWIAIMSVSVGSPAWRYAIQAAASAVLFCVLKPWRYYPRVKIAQLPLALAVGVVVGVVWILPESPWMFNFPYAHDLYLKWGIRPLGVITGTEATSPYSPDQCGWGLTLLKLTGSALVIATAEEFFWRGFLYRWFVAREFLGVDPGRIHRAMFVITALLFGMEHDRWLVGTVAGFAYGWLYARTSNIWAAVFAHIVTNFLLGLYVLVTASYFFW